MNDPLKEWNLTYAQAVKFGADPIEILAGHLCGPRCMHWESMNEEHRARLKKAPWNAKYEWWK